MADWAAVAQEAAKAAAAATGETVMTPGWPVLAAGADGDSFEHH